MSPQKLLLTAKTESSLQAGMQKMLIPIQKCEIETKSLQKTKARGSPASHPHVSPPEGVGFRTISFGLREHERAVRLFHKSLKPAFGLFVIK